MSTDRLDDLLADGRRNAVLSWLLVAVASAVWIGEVVVSAFLWSVFALVVVVLAVLPPIVYRSRWVMLPWEVLAMATLPLIGLAIGTQRFSSPLFAYLAVAAVALVIVVELDTFSSIRLSPGFAVGLVVVATMAAAAVWELLQWYAAVALERGYDTTNDELMVEFTYSALAGLGAGVIFRAYFRRRGATTRRLPPEVDVTLPQKPAVGEHSESDGTGNGAAGTDAGESAADAPGDSVAGTNAGESAAGAEADESAAVGGGEAPPDEDGAADAGGER